MKKAKIIVTLFLIISYLLSLSLSVLADGVYYDYFEINENKNAVNINTAISKINNINTVDYNNRFSVYDANKTFIQLTDKEQSYVVNTDKLLSSINTLNTIGDLNANGVRNSEDLTLLIDCLLGKSNTIYKADINEDKNVNILDLIAIKKLIAGI